MPVETFFSNLSFVTEALQQAAALACCKASVTNERLEKKVSTGTRAPFRILYGYGLLR